MAAAKGQCVQCSTEIQDNRVYLVSMRIRFWESRKFDLLQLNDEGFCSLECLLARIRSEQQRMTIVEEK